MFLNEDEKLKQIRILKNKTGWTSNRIEKETGILADRVHRLLANKAKLKDGEADIIINAMEKVLGVKDGP